MLEKSADDVINENNEEHFQNAEYDYQRKVRSNNLIRAFLQEHIFLYVQHLGTKCGINTSYRCETPEENWKSYCQG